MFCHVCYGISGHPPHLPPLAQKPVPQDVVDDIVEAVRLSSCGANRQRLRLVVVQSRKWWPKCSRWSSGGLPAPGTGHAQADETPTLYVAVLQDSSASGDLSTDTGIALANMTLAAWDKEVGSCIMGAINKPALTELLGIEEPLKLACMVAFGYPTHAARVVPMTRRPGVKYYLDENRDYCVPKRSRDEIARCCNAPVKKLDFLAYIHIFNGFLHISGK